MPRITIKELEQLAREQRDVISAQSEKIIKLESTIDAIRRLAAISVISGGANG